MSTALIVDFLNRFTAALGITATVQIDETPDGPRLNLTGEEAEILVRHRGDPLKALQHVVDMSFGRTLPDDRRVFVDALEYRRGKDVELRQMAKFLAQKAIRYPNYYYTGSQDELVNAFNFGGELPVTIVFDKNGKEVYRVQGAIEKKKFVEKLNQLLKQ